MRSRLLSDVLLTTFGREWARSRIELTSDEITARLRPYLDINQPKINRYFDRRRDLVEAPVKVLNWLLRQVNLKLARRRPRNESDQRITLYSIDRHDLRRCRATQAVDWMPRMLDLGSRCPKICGVYTLCSTDFGTTQS